MDLVPAVRGVVDPGADHLDPLPDLGDRDARAIPGDDLENQVAPDAAIARREQAVLPGVEPKLEVDVTVVELWLDPLDCAGGNPAAALHLEPFRVVDADE